MNQKLLSDRKSLHGTNKKNEVGKNKARIWKIFNSNSNNISSIIKILMCIFNKLKAKLCVNYTVSIYCYIHT